MGTAHMLHGTTLSTALQIRVDDAYRGRVMSVFLVAVLSGIPLGGLTFGILSDLVGLRWVALGAGCLLVIHALVFQHRGLLVMLDNEVVEVDGGAYPTGPVAEPPDSGDDRRTDDGPTDRL
jgi:MFS family permease